MVGDLTSVTMCGRRIRPIYTVAIGVDAVALTTPWTLRHNIRRQIYAIGEAIYRVQDLIDGWTCGPLTSEMLSFMRRSQRFQCTFGGRVDQHRISLPTLSADVAKWWKHAITP